MDAEPAAPDDENIDSLNEDAKNILEELLREDVLFELDDDGMPRVFTIQVRIQKLQQRIQRQIRELKAGPRDASFTGNLAQLRTTMNRAKVLGDTFVWMLMGFEVPSIGLLSENTPPPVHSDDEIGDLGVLAAAKIALNGKWGIPVLHDISSVLRVGDLSVLKFSEAGAGQIQTFEIKTHHKGMSEDGAHILDVSFLSVGAPAPPIVETVELPPRGEAEVSTKKQRPRRSSARINRQWRRLERVHIGIKSLNQGPVPLPDGNQTIFATLDGEAAPWPTEFFEKLLQDGVASGMLDPYTVILGVHADSEADLESKLNKSPFVEHVRSLLTGGDPDEHVYAQALPMKQAGGSLNPRVYTTLGIPKEVIVEMFAGTTVILVITTWSAVKKAYADRGFVAKREPVEGTDWGDFYLSRELTIDENRFNYEHHHEGWQLLKSMLELKGVKDAAAMAANLATMPNLERKIIDHIQNASTSSEPPASPSL